MLIVISATNVSKNITISTLGRSLLDVSCVSNGSKRSLPVIVIFEHTIASKLNVVYVTTLQLKPNTWSNMLKRLIMTTKPNHSTFLNRFKPIKTCPKEVMFKLNESIKNPSSL